MAAFGLLRPSAAALIITFSNSSPFDCCAGVGGLDVPGATGGLAGTVGGGGLGAT